MNTEADAESTVMRKICLAQQFSPSQPAHHRYWY